MWQFIAGGGEDNESVLLSAKRESFEEAGIQEDRQFKKLESMCYVPVNYFSEEARQYWDNKYVIPVYTFAVQLQSEVITLSHEHTEYRWCTYNQALALLYFDLDKTALYELKEKLSHGYWNR